MTTTVSHSKPARLAAAALAAAQADKTNTAAGYIKRISDECGGEGLEVALRTWCDATVDHATDGDRAAGRPNISFVNAKTGELDNAASDRVPPSIRWAGRLIAARAALDLDAYRALLDELPEDGAEIGTYFLAVVNVVATTINGLPRGYARMGSRP